MTGPKPSPRVPGSADLLTLMGLEYGTWILSNDREFPDPVEDIFTFGEVHLLGGSRGAGKSAFETWMMSHIIAEKDFLGHKTHNPPWMGCMILDRESNDRELWWETAGVETPPFYCLAEDERVTPEAILTMTPVGFFEFFKRQLQVMKPEPGGLLVVDVMNPMAGDGRTSYLSGYAHGLSISKLVRQMKLTCIGIMHGGKQQQGSQYLRATDRIIGGTGFLGTTGTVSYLCTAEETAMDFRNSGKRGPDKVQAMNWVPHHHKTEDFYFTRTENGLFEEVEIDNASSRLPPASQKNTDLYIKRRQLILEAIPEKGSRMDELTYLIEKHTISPSAFYRAVDKLLSDGFLEKRDGVLYRTKPN